MNPAPPRVKTPMGHGWHKIRHIGPFGVARASYYIDWLRSRKVRGEEYGLIRIGRGYYPVVRDSKG